MNNQSKCIKRSKFYFLFIYLFIFLNVFFVVSFINILLLDIIGRLSQVSFCPLSFWRHRLLLWRFRKPYWGSYTLRSSRNVQRKCMRLWLGNKLKTTNAMRRGLCSRKWGYKVGNSRLPKNFSKVNWFFLEIARLKNNNW